MFKKIISAVLSAALVTGCMKAAHSTDHFSESIKCLADNMYWEARNQPFAGQVAVSNVVLNRVDDPRFPNTVCEVIHQGPTKKSWSDPTVYYPVRHRCQFSWYCDGKSDEIPESDREMYQHMRSAALKVYTGWFGDNTFGATHYHASYVKPDWAASKTRTTKIGLHIFYKWEQ